MTTRAVLAGAAGSETARLAAMADLGYAEAAEQHAFQALASIFRTLLDLPVASVTVAETDDLVLTGGAGIAATCRIGRAGTFCDTVVRTARPLVVLDAAADPRFAQSCHVVGPDNLFRFYVGIPLATSAGHVVGTLCGFDTRVRLAPDAARIAAVTTLAQAPIRRLELQAAQRLHREREAALIQRTELLETTLNSIAQGITAFDGDMTLQAWNGAALEMLGFPEELAYRGKPYLDCVKVTAGRGLYGPGDPDELAQARLVSATKARRFDLERTLNSGRTIRLRGVPLPEGGFLTTYTDVTQDRAHEAELVARSRYFAWHGAVDMISNEADDLETAIGRYIESFCSHTSYDVAHVLKMTPTGLRSTGRFYRREADVPDDLPKRLRAMTILSRLARSAAVDEAGVILENGDLDFGDLRPYVPAACRGGISYATRIISDLYVFEFYGPVALTAKPTHKPLLAHAEAALSRVAERERIARLQDEFVSTIGAKLQAPLASIRSILRRLPRAGTSDEIRAILDVTDLDSRRLRHLINNLMLVQELDGDGCESERRSEDVAALVDRAIHNQNGTARVAVRSDERGIRAATRSEAVVHILDNLVSNALKFSPPEAAVDVGIGRRRGLVRITVRDRGPGIPAEFRRSIFGRFALANSSDTRRFGGTGLGLAVAKGLAEKLGGSLDYRAAAGGGTIFVLDLPAAESLSNAA